MHPVKRFQRRITARLAQLFENGALWQETTGARPVGPRTLRRRFSDPMRTVVGLPLFNRRLGRYYTGRNDPVTLERLAQRPGWQVDCASIAPGIGLSGAVAVPRDQTAPWLLYFLGNWGDQLLKSQLLLEELRGSNDWGLAMWAPRGYETSGGTPHVQDFCADARLLYQRLVEVFGAHEGRIHLVGFSLGALLAASLAGELERQGRPVASLSLLSFHPAGFAMRTTSSRWYAPWILPDWFHPMVAAQWMPRRTLLMHAADDATDPVEDARRFAVSLGARGRYIEVPRGGHQSTIAPASLGQVREFIGTTEST
ncbi:MAG: hypothetical protein QM718_13665 [Steroidobacteraceae bacterium]